MVASSSRESQEAWNAATLRLLERGYLEASGARGACGFRGDAARWREAREVIVAALHASGTFLDAGCAGGLLLASVRAWAAERGLAIEPFGLELSPALAARARAAYPEWAGRVFVGGVTTWTPSRQFDFVRIELLYAPPAGRRALVAHCLDRLVAPGGRLVVCSYAGGRPGRPLTSIAWVERAA